MASDFKRKAWALGEICQHDSLGRKCDICALSEDLAEAEATITALRAALALLGAECRAWRRLSDAAEDAGWSSAWEDHGEECCSAEAATDSSPTAAAAVKGST